MILRWIMKAADSAKATRLNLSDKGLTSLPAGIAKLTNIQS